MNRKQRRAAAHKARKLARKAGFPTPQPIPPPSAATQPVAIPETPISDAQLAANRANAQSSTGPKTEASRATSSQNRTTHGLARSTPKPLKSPTKSCSPTTSVTKPPTPAPSTNPSMTC